MLLDYLVCYQIFRHTVCNMPRKRPFSTVSGPTTAQQDSALLRLPAELRNMIYEFTFSHCRVEIPRRRKRESYGRSKPNNLLLACRQIHEEAIQLYYIHATFCFDTGGLYRLPEWVKKIGLARAMLLKHVNFGLGISMWCFSFRYSDEIALSHVQGLESTLNRYKSKAPGLTCGLKVDVNIGGCDFTTSSPIALAKAIFDVTAQHDMNRWWAYDPPGYLKQRFRDVMPLQVNYNA